MVLPERLGGFKILKDIRWTSVVSAIGGEGFAGDVCSRFSDEKINLSLLTCGGADVSPSVRFAVESPCAEKVLQIIKTWFPDTVPQQKDAQVLSVFPHRNNPEIVGAILRILVQKEISPLALLNSPSAISIVLDKEHLDRTAAALFEPFRFSAYQTPADWKLAQQGKEQLYKEVIASYQEKKPKVYALEWYGDQVLVQARLPFMDLAVVAEVFCEKAPLKMFLTFFALNPIYETGFYDLLFCLPISAVQCTEYLHRRLSGKTELILSPAAFFSMNGPHFGDRYGIAKNLYVALIQSGVKVLGLNCSIASISGIVPAEQILPAIQAIEARFDVPSVIRRD